MNLLQRAHRGSKAVASRRVLVARRFGRAATFQLFRNWEMSPWPHTAFTATLLVPAVPDGTLTRTPNSRFDRGPPCGSGLTSPETLELPRGGKSFHHRGPSLFRPARLRPSPAGRRVSALSAASRCLRTRSHYAAAPQG